MSRREVVSLVCDMCGKDAAEVVGVETRRVQIDGIAVEAEICDGDYQPILEAFAVFARAGRELPRKTPTRGAKAYPGTHWKFSDHALMRLAERHLDPLQIVKVCDSPEITRPGNASDLEIRERNGLKAVVAPERLVIITVARKDEEVDR